MSWDDLIADTTVKFDKLDEITESELTDALAKFSDEDVEAVIAHLDERTAAAKSRKALVDSLLVAIRLGTRILSGGAINLAPPADPPA